MEELSSLSISYGNSKGGPDSVLGKPVNQHLLTRKWRHQKANNGSGSHQPIAPQNAHSTPNRKGSCEDGTRAEAPTDGSSQKEGTIPIQPLRSQQQLGPH